MSSFGHAPLVLVFQVLRQLLDSVQRAHVLSTAGCAYVHHKLEGPQEELVGQMAMGEQQLGRFWLPS